MAKATNITHIRSLGKDIIDVTPRGGVAIQFKDLFNVGDLITEMHEWVVENLNAPSSDRKFPEVFYHHRFNQGGLEEMRAWWRLQDRATNFITYHYDIDFRILAITKREVMYQGMKFKTNHGDAEVRIWGYMELNKNDWQKNAITAAFYDLFTKRMYYDQIQTHRQNVYDNVQKLMNYLKEFFKLKTVQPTDMQGMYMNREYE